jgi:hypothetical protein
VLGFVNVPQDQRQNGLTAATTVPSWQPYTKCFAVGDHDTFEVTPMSVSSSKVNASSPVETFHHRIMPFCCHKPSASTKGS